MSFSNVSDGTNTSTTSASEINAPLPAGVTWVAVVTFSLTALVGIVLYVLIFVVIFKQREKFQFAFYKFFITLGVAEIVSLLYYGPFGSFCLLGAFEAGTSTYCPIPIATNYVLSSMASWTIWFVEFTVHPLIAIDRFVAIFFFAYHKTIFAGRPAIMMCVGAWIAACALAAPILLWEIPAAYFVWGMASFFDTDSEASVFYNSVTIAIEMTVIAICCALYAACVIALIVRQRRRVGGETATRNSGSHKAQRKLTIQGALHFSLLFVYNVMWELMPSVSSVWVYYASTLLLQAIPLNTAVVTVVFNDGIREEIWKLFRSCGSNGLERANEVELGRWASRRISGSSAVITVSSPRSPIAGRRSPIIHAR